MYAHGKKIAESIRAQSEADGRRRRPREAADLNSLEQADHDCEKGYGNFEDVLNYEVTLDSENVLDFKGVLDSEDKDEDEGNNKEEEESQRKKRNRCYAPPFACEMGTHAKEECLGGGGNSGSSGDWQEEQKAGKANEKTDRTGGGRTSDVSRLDMLSCLHRYVYMRWFQALSWIDLFAWDSN